MSPILANIYLDRFDKWVESELLPAHNRKAERRRNPAYYNRSNKASVLAKAGRHAEAAALRKQAKRQPVYDTRDPDYRRLRYVRYADDFLLGFAGPKAEAEEIKRRVGAFLRDTLKLELSGAKTLVTHARTGAARFLGYAVSIHHDDTARSRRGSRGLNGSVSLALPVDVVRKKVAPLRRHGKVVHRAERLHDSVFGIVAQFQAEYRGVVQYYRLAHNLHRLGRLRWATEQALTKTLAAKLKVSRRTVYARFGATLETPDGAYQGLRVVIERPGKRPLVAAWGGIPLKRNLDVALADDPPRIWNDRTDLEQRLLAGACELCGSRSRVEVHHVRSLRDLRTRGRAARPAWVQKMAARQRKTLVVCKTCHEAIHHGRPTGTPRTDPRRAPHDAARAGPAPGARTVTLESRVR